MQSKAATVADYMAQLPPERRAHLQVVRDVILKNLDRKFEEGMQYGMIGYYVPHSIYPSGYHCDPRQPLPFGGLASQKNHMSVHLMGLYGDNDEEKWFRSAWAKTGKKLDMGKCCIRFKKAEDLALELIGQAVARMPIGRYIEYYELSRKVNTSRMPGATKSASKSVTSKPKAKAAKVVARAAKKTSPGKSTSKSVKRKTGSR